MLPRVHTIFNSSVISSPPLKEKIEAIFIYDEKRLLLIVNLQLPIVYNPKKKLNYLSVPEEKEFR